MKDSVGLIGQGIKIEGDISVDGALRVEGTIIGHIHGSGGTISIGESGHVIDDISADVCIIAGKLEGDVDANTRVEITPSGRLKGKVITQNLIIAEGAIFEGQLQMKQDEVISKLNNTKNQHQEQNTPQDAVA
jgi:cytoskeletal protein CcmA (bactofilin family)